VPLTADDFIQENSGTTTASTSILVTLPSGTTLDTTLIVVFYASQAVTAAPSGFTKDKQPASGAGGVLYVYRRSSGAAAETSWTWTLTAAGDAAWYVAELTNIDPADPLESAAETGDASVSNGGTLSTQTTAQGAGLSTVAFAAFGAMRANSGVTVGFGSYTNEFEEIADLASPSTPGTHLAVARKFVAGTTAQFESTATYSTTGAAASADAVMVAYRAADAGIAAPLNFFTGLEWGTHGGINQPTTVRGMLASSSGAFGTYGTHYLIQAGSARNGGYGLRLVSAGSALQGTTGFGTPAASASFCTGFNVRVVSATGTVIVAYWTTSTNNLQLVYNASTTQFGLRWGAGGTITYQTGTTALNTWVWMDVGGYTDSSSRYGKWRLETATNTYTDQPDCNTTAGSFGTPAPTLGEGAASQTSTMDFDDLVTCRYFAAYPLGPHTVRLLKVDPAGTPTVSGTSDNFKVMTANGTLAAWNDILARNAVDEVPPTVSALADGVVQSAVAASDYMQFPMETYTAGPTEIIAGVRMVACMWGGTGTGTGTLGIRGWDGTTETTLIDTSVSYDADSLTTMSATHPYWQTAMWQYGAGWTQAALNAAALRVGFSTDATPDMGVNALYLEVATREAIPFAAARLTSDEDPTVDAALVTETIHPYNSGVRTYTISNDDPTRTVEFNYSIADVPQTAIIVAPSDPPESVTVGAEAFGEVTSTSFGWQ
jgi:hypothetical protein